MENVRTYILERIICLGYNYVDLCYHGFNLFLDKNVSMHSKNGQLFQFSFVKLF